MNKRFREWSLTCKSGLFVILIYTTCTMLSWILFPRAYNPINNWLSDLGNYGWNPVGAFFYNFGCIFTGIALFPFFIGLKDWYIEHKLNRILIKLSQVIGGCSAIALIFIGIFSEDFGFLHGLWSAIYFLLNFILLIIGSFALLTYERSDLDIPIKLGGIIGFIVAGINLTFMLLVLLVGFAAIVEWITVFTSLAFVGVIIYFGKEI